MFTCSLCGHTGPKEDFYTEPRNSGRGFTTSWCRECKKLSVAKNRARLKLLRSILHL